jgi:hypothetical protein
MTQGIALALPASWSSIDLDPAASEKSSERVVEAAIPPGPGAAEARGLMLGLLRQAADEARQRRAVLAALYSSAADGIPLGASLVASVLEAKPGPDRRPAAEGPDLAESLRTVVGGGVGERRDLPAGAGVRLQRRQMTGIAGAAVEVATVQWFVLHPSGERMALLSFSTPNLALAEPFGEVFDAIAWSLQWTD